MIDDEILEKHGLDENIVRTIHGMNGTYSTYREMVEDERREDEVVIPTNPSKLRTRDHLKYWDADYNAGTKLGKHVRDFWIATLIDRDTVVITSRDSVRPIVQAALGSLPGFPPATHLLRLEVENRVLCVRDVVRDFDATGTVPLVATTLKRLVVYDVHPMLSLQQKLSRWSRQGQYIPELLITSKASR